MAAVRTLRRTLDVEPQVLRRLAIAKPQRYPVLFDSVASGPLGRYSILLAQPSAALVLAADGRLSGHGIEPAHADFFTSLESWWRSQQQPALPAAADSPELAFAGGWAIFLSYEMAQEVEPRLRLPRSQLPWRAFALRSRSALVHEQATDRIFAVAEADAALELDGLERDAYWAAGQREEAPAAALALRIREEDPARFLDQVRSAQEHIRAGDIYQANLSRRWTVCADSTSGGRRLNPSRAGEIYARLCAANPAPFAALVQWGGVALLSSSPERLIRVEGADAETRPIAGTRPRSRRPGEDRAEAAALVAHPKERAEHIMLIDLERNDLGRVCEAGTVRVDEFMVTETYAHVHHIVSNVRGRLRPDVTPLGALRAVFPGGTITGCPKIRCMEIIAELEGEGRGAYTGSLGYLTREGLLDSNILIRTMTLGEEGMTLRAGAGIVADSDPERELEETRAKARGLLAALSDGPAETSGR